MNRTRKSLLPRLTPNPEHDPLGKAELAALGDVLSRGTAKTKIRLERKIERERIILGDLPELSVQILELARERGRVTISEAAKATRANRNTIKDHVKALTVKGHLARHGAGRGTWYSLV